MRPAPTLQSHATMIEVALQTGFLWYILDFNVDKQIY